MTRAPASDGAFGLGRVVHLDQRRQPDGHGAFDQGDQRLLLERGDDEQHQVGAARAGLPQLVARDDEVLAQHRDVDRGAHRVQIGQRAAEPALLGEHADAGRTAGFVVGGERGRVVDACELALGRAAALDLGDHPDPVLAAQRRYPVDGRPACGGGGLEVIHGQQRLTLGQVGAHAFEDVVEHAHAWACPSARDRTTRAVRPSG